MTDLLKIVKIIWGNPFRRISTILVSAGIALLSQPFWLPLLHAFLQQERQLTYYRGDVAYTGWGLIVLGVVLLVYYDLIQRPVKIKKGSNSKTNQDYILGEVSGNIIRIGDIVQHSQLFVSVNKEELLELISNEFKSHPIFSEIDYESLPIPLKKEYFIVASKKGGVIFVEDISRTPPNEELTVKWKDLSSKYVNAYKLPYRKDSQILKNRLKYKQSIRVIDEIITSLTAYIRQSTIYNDKDLYKRLHNLKGKILASRNLAEVNYIKYSNGGDPDKFISQVVLNLEMVISCAHKVILEYLPPK